eukprot:TRINITY_DN11073_c0_g1_i1.p1 TRINITY_DN11073_c0_g1~~TRINITY_DN11073_c0_g1_i1.p1  ORF type:complete len:143 (+),score=8.14 TRINITY_DN11073_c0_g1_i1:472-900(+)
MRPYPKESFGCGKGRKTQWNHLDVGKGWKQSSEKCGHRHRHTLFNYSILVTIISPAFRHIQTAPIDTSKRHPFFNVGPQFLLEMLNTVHRCNQHTYAHQNKNRVGIRSMADFRQLSVSGKSGTHTRGSLNENPKFVGPTQYD